MFALNMTSGFQQTKQAHEFLHRQGLDRESELQSGTGDDDAGTSLRTILKEVEPEDG